ncbi:TadE/TadG family type IV pilus assembly protein [Allostreptomyces psammosilenae]|uniref:Flp pilus assembly protein TadG n=1 Tax=Allostreptomyces psammosilenae TaxID=1892865 RepID=A0A852ZLH8_9ACTN|nr:TadE/TadG family type IV pilus assembly protein [Allostreptomyces psammosilenae]NYI03243.1 Flp pilus assembly protein TadG [Allostreptomyces psammosilenae]
MCRTVAAEGVAARRERGSVELETAILAPVLLALVLLAVAAGRLVTTASSVDSAARDAARAASLTRTPDAAGQAASDAARMSVERQGLGCSPSVVVNTDDFAGSGDLPGSVTVTVSCTVPLGDLALPGLPGSRTLTSEFTSPVDRYRGVAG